MLTANVGEARRRHATRPGRGNRAGNAWRRLTVAGWTIIAITSAVHAQQASSASPLPVGAAAPVQTLPEGATPSGTPTAHAISDVDRDVEALSGLFQGGGRYRITVGDVIHLSFPYVPEFEQTVTVQPDGYVSLRAVGDIQARGLTVSDLKLAVAHAYEPILNQPVISVVLKEFEKPYVVVAGEVTRPGKYELRGAMTLTQAIAIAGGKTSSGKLSDVVLFRRFANDQVSAKQIDVKKMYAKRSLAEDPILRPGDTIFLPRSAWSQIQKLIPVPGLGIYANPAIR